MNARRQQGAALIIALVVVAMATILATTLVWESHLERRRTANQLYGSEALANALAVEDFVRAMLLEDDRESDHLQEPWARQGDVFPIEGGALSGQVIDLQGRYNINNLYDWQQGEVRRDQLDKFRELVQSIGLDERIVAETIDWIDPDIAPSDFNGAEDDAYLRNTPAYRTANQPLADVDELRLLASMTPEQFAVLQPYVTALPVDPQAPVTAVNVNTAPPELMVALGMSPDDASRVVELRQQDGIPPQQLQQVAQSLSANDLAFFGATSNFFRLRTLAVIGASRVTMYSVLRRDPDTGAVRTLSRSLGTP